MAKHTHAIEMLDQRMEAYANAIERARLCLASNLADADRNRSEIDSLSLDMADLRETRDLLEKR